MAYSVHIVYEHVQGIVFVFLYITKNETTAQQFEHNDSP